MTARNGGDAEDRVEARSPSKDEGDAPLTARYPMIAFSFRPDASRLVLLYRDPATGQTVDQIPSEAALKQYEEAQKKAETRKKLEVIVGGADEGKARSGGASGSSGAFSASVPAASPVNGSGDTAAARADGLSANTVRTASTYTAGAAPVSMPSGTSTGGTAPHVNVVI